MNNEPDGQRPLNEQLLDLFVYAPTGLVVTAADQVPRLVALGRGKLEVRVSSARAVGQFAVQVGRQQLVRRTEELLSRRPGISPGSAEEEGAMDPTSDAAGQSVPRRRQETARTARSLPTTVPAPSLVSDRPGSESPKLDAGIPEVSALAIPGFDTLSASQVVQRLDGLSRDQLELALAYETRKRGRRTILNRINQLLDERL